ncbi:MAG: TonB-dependent receptor family protein, partial [Persicimonas sp.]
EGMGLRQNIGIRGLNPNRSRKVLMLEDGVPISLAPYGEPEMYYTPPVERMERIELVKGSGSILHGPQTIGGVINYITPNPPDDLEVEAEARGGAYDYATGRASVGNTHGNVGYYVSGLHQRFGGPRDLNLERTDLFAKFQARPTETQSVSLKLNVYDESSASTYLGLTTPQYQADPQANFAENDEFNIRRYAASLSHVAMLNDDVLLETRVYGHNIDRQWQRQDFAREFDEDADYERIIDGRGRDITGADNPPDDGSAIYFLDSSGNRNREFTVGGVEPRITVDWELGEVENELLTGARFHYEQAEEQYIAGEHASSPTGVIESDQLRTGHAVAGYALNRFLLLDRRLKISPGLRLESLWTNLTTYRDQESGEEPRDLDPPDELDNHHFAPLPGLGVSYDLTNEVTLFGGAHRGWAPPRTKDAVIGGDTVELEAEHSWNYELGVRSRFDDWAQAELAGFYLDFDNQVIAPNEAGGAVSEGIVNGGESIHMGAEASATVDPARAADADFRLPLSANYTYVHAEFGDEGWGAAIRGQTLPYAPEHQLAARAAFEHPLGFDVQLDANYLSEQYTDKVETVDPSVDGLQGEIDARFVLDAQASYLLEPIDTTAFVTVKNVFDEEYIASRSPRGIQPGAPRLLYAGLRYQY